MIMLLTQDRELREQLSEALQHSGHQVIIPPHRETMLSMLEGAQPSLIILDLHLSDPSGTQDLRMIRAQGYVGKIIVLSSPSMLSVLSETYASGVDRILKAPVTINGGYDLGELRATVQSCLQDSAVTARRADHGAVARRAYQLYEAGGHQDGSHVRHWLQAEREVAVL
jgi:DNA-binding response OmpR family regulator